MIQAAVEIVVTATKAETKIQRTVEKQEKVKQSPIVVVLDCPLIVLLPLRVNFESIQVIERVKNQSHLKF